MSTSYLNYLLILNHLLEEGNQVLSGKRILGYALMASDFNKTNKKLSRRIFSSYCQELLDNQFIIRIKNSDDRSKYYTITPLGICYLLLNDTKEIKYFTLRRILNILQIFYDNSSSKILKSIEFETDSVLEQLLKIYSKKSLCQNFVFSVVDCFHLFQKKYVTVSFNVSINLKLILAYLTLDKMNASFSEIIDNEITKKSLENKQFHSVFSLYMLVLFFNSLIPNLANEPTKRNLQKLLYKNTKGGRGGTSGKKQRAKELKSNQKYLESINKMGEFENSFKI